MSIFSFHIVVHTYFGLIFNIEDFEAILKIWNDIVFFCCMD